LTRSANGNVPLVKAMFAIYWAAIAVGIVLALVVALTSP
jgi:hypothetical protein